MTFNDVKVNWLPLFAAVLTAAVISGVWYSPLVLGKEWMALRSAEGGVSDPRLVPWRPVVELIREFVVACVMLRLVRETRVGTLGEAARLGFWVWLGFPVMMLAGASLWDSKSWELSLIHGGDWFLKMLAMPMVIAAMRRLETQPQPAAGGPFAASASRPAAGS
jgi:Protein of unknown function (DUF1761)